MKRQGMVPCDHVIAKLWEFIDDELTEERAGEVRAHLDACAHCFPQYDFQRAYLTFVRRVEQQPVPAGLRKRVFQQILEEEARE
jgi:anti-sigma factor (TIGR02949 family)